MTMTARATLPSGTLRRVRAKAASAEMKMPSGTLMKEMMTLLRMVVARSPRSQALVKFSQAISVGSPKAPVLMRSGFDLSAVSRMKKTGVTQMTAMASRVIQRTTLTGSLRAMRSLMRRPSAPSRGSTG